MKLLLIAPDQPGISWAGEIEAITEGHHSVVLTGDVTEERIVNRTSGETFDVIHFVAHGTDEGIDMVNWVMPPKQVAQLANHVRAELVFLNICRSIFLPQFLIDQHVPSVIAHTRAAGVSDNEALRLASYFYDELSRSAGDFHRAYQKVSPHDGTLAWSSNGQYLGALEPMAEDLSKVREYSRANRDLIRLLIGLIVPFVVSQIYDIYLHLSYWLKFGG